MNSQNWEGRAPGNPVPLKGRHNASWNVPYPQYTLTATCDAPQARAKRDKLKQTEQAVQQMPHTELLSKYKDLLHRHDKLQENHDKLKVMVPSSFCR